jgi:hypothetical protein
MIALLRPQSGATRSPPPSARAFGSGEPGGGSVSRLGLDLKMSELGQREPKKREHSDRMTAACARLAFVRERPLPGCNL